MFFRYIAAVFFTGTHNTRIVTRPPGLMLRNQNFSWNLFNNKLSLISLLPKRRCIEYIMLQSFPHYLNHCHTFMASVCIREWQFARFQPIPNAMSGFVSPQVPNTHHTDLLCHCTPGHHGLVLESRLIVFALQRSHCVRPYGSNLIPVTDLGRSDYSSMRSFYTRAISQGMVNISIIGVSLKITDS